MPIQISRREFVSISAGSLAFGTQISRLFGAWNQRGFKLSLNESSLDHQLKEKKIDHLDLARIAKQEFGIDAIEYVSSYFSGHLADEKYIKQMNRRAAAEAVRQILIVVNDAGQLADADSTKRAAAVKEHHPWIDLAKTLGCHSVCVQIAGEGSADEKIARGSESLAQLADYAKDRRIHVLVCCCGKQNWQAGHLLKLMEETQSRNIGLYPSVGGFGAREQYDELARLMPFAKGVRATASQFDDSGNETSIDFHRAIKTILDAGYRGYVGIHYRGKSEDEMNGIRSTKALLERTLAAEMNSKS